VQDFRATLDWVPQDSRIGVCDREQLELDRGNDGEAAAAAAQRPEQVRLMFAVGAYEPAVGGHELDRAHVVGGQPVFAAEEADPAPERVADHTDIGRGARQRREAMLCRGLDNLEPNRSRLDPGCRTSRIDRDPAHPLGLEQDRVLERAERSRAVAGALRR
jgi:hypothetical protein